MTDDRWNIKGSDESTLDRFREIKRGYEAQRDERVTDERALQLLMDDVPVERDGDTKAILEQLDGLESAVSDRVVERIREQHY